MWSDSTGRYIPQTLGPTWGGLLGNDPGYVASELQRRLSDAFLPDNRILGITDFSYTFRDTTLTAQVTVNTVFGPVQTAVEVTLS